MKDVVLLSSLTAPSKIIGVGLNYHGHVSETGGSPNDKPTLFSRWPDTHVGHGARLVLPSVSEYFDYEGELALIIGRAGRRIPEAEAMTHVAGYSCYNDGSIRDRQRHSTQFLFRSWLAQQTVSLR